MDPQNALIVPLDILYIIFQSSETKTILSFRSTCKRILEWMNKSYDKTFTLNCDLEFGDSLQYCETIGLVCFGVLRTSVHIINLLPPTLIAPLLNYNKKIISYPQETFNALILVPTKQNLYIFNYTLEKLFRLNYGDHTRTEMKLESIDIDCISYHSKKNLFYGCCYDRDFIAVMKEGERVAIINLNLNGVVIADCQNMILDEDENQLFCAVNCPNNLTGIVKLDLSTKACELVVSFPYRKQAWVADAINNPYLAEVYSMTLCKKRKSIYFIEKGVHDIMELNLATKEITTLLNQETLRAGRNNNDPIRDVNSLVYVEEHDALYVIHTRGHLACIPLWPLYQK